MNNKVLEGKYWMRTWYTKCKRITEDKHGSSETGKQSIQELDKK